MSLAQAFLAVGAKLPTGFNNPITTGTVLFQTAATFRTAQIFFPYRAVTVRTFFFLTFLPPAEKKQTTGNQQSKKNPEEPAMVKILTMPGISPCAIHNYLKWAPE